VSGHHSTRYGVVLLGLVMWRGCLWVPVCRMRATGVRWVRSRLLCGCGLGGEVGFVLIVCLKSLMVLFPRSILIIGHLPSLCFSSCSWRSLKVLLCLDVRSWVLDLHPPRRCVLISGWLHLVHIMVP
jgi:hypothetical protein